MIHQEAHAFSGDLFYLMYCILFYHLQEEKSSSIYHLIHSFFDITNSKGEVINVFDTMLEINTKSYDFIGFFMSKLPSFFKHYFGTTYDVNIFYSSFTPQHMISLLQREFV
jgi:hypothetical protein